MQADETAVRVPWPAQPITTAFEPPQQCKATPRKRLSAPIAHTFGDMGLGLGATPWLVEAVPR